MCELIKAHEDGEDKNNWEVWKGAGEEVKSELHLGKQRHEKVWTFFTQNTSDPKSVVLPPAPTSATTTTTNSLTSAECPTTQINFGTLPGGGVRSHKLRAPFYKTAPTSVPVESCGSFVTALVALAGHRGLVLTPSHCAGHSHLPEGAQILGTLDTTQPFLLQGFVVCLDRRGKWWQPSQLGFLCPSPFPLGNKAKSLLLRAERGH